MSIASESFTQSILDAENLLKHFNDLNVKPPPPETEVLKRAGLIMAMTAWETYVEDRLVECNERKLASLNDEDIADFVKSKLDEEIKRLHNPTSEKTIQLFLNYAGVDLSDKWSWPNVDSKTARERLNKYMKLRGDVVHRSRPHEAGPSRAHPVTKDDLVKAISFLKNLVQATETALQG